MMLVDTPSAGMIAGTGIRLIVPYGGPAIKLIDVLPLALPCTLTAVIFAVPTTVEDLTIKPMMPLVVDTCMPA